MTTTAEPTTDQTVALDDIAGWVETYHQAGAQIAKLEELRGVARQHIEAALGDHEVGTVNGRPVVRWTVVTSRRLDQKKLKADHPDLAEALTVPSTSRRFTLVKDDDQ
jgi:predicted phage-related endonuclease